VINLGSILVGNATLVVANVLTCNNHSPYRPYMWSAPLVNLGTGQVGLLLWCMSAALPAVGCALPNSAAVCPGVCISCN
jgi:hypothetical protein